MQLSKDDIFNNIMMLIDEGLELARNNIAHSSNDPSFDGRVNTWIQNSQITLESITKSEIPSVYLNYLKLLLQLQKMPDLSSMVKLTSCIEYLIDIAKMLNKL